MRDENKNALTDAETQALANDKSFLMTFGQVVYRDDFGIHWTRFCGWKNYGFGNQNDFNNAACIEFSDVGDGLPPPFPNPSPSSEKK